MSLSSKIFTGLFLGLAAGLVFGEMTAFLQPVGEAFIQLLKMAVLPYIVVSVIAGLGSLGYAEAARLSLRVGGLLLLIWAITFAVVLLVPLTFPQLETASFFSTTLLQEPQRFDLLQYIPANPFGSMANNVVPAVVLFSLAVGVALMGVGNKRVLIENLEIIGEALSRVMRFVARLTPVGVFAIAASASGTMHTDQLGRLQVYVLTYVVTALLMTFGVLPALAMLLTPLRYREILARTRDPLVTGFATDSLLIVLPLLAEQGKQLMREQAAGDEEAEAVVDVIVPSTFNFPHAGKLLQLIFVLFAAWFTEASLGIADKANLLFSGLFTFFGKPVAGIPFLLDLVRVPADMFELYLVSGVFAARFGTLAAVMQTFVIAAVGAMATAGLVQVRWSRIFVASALAGGMLLATGIGTRLYFGSTLERSYDKGRILAQMHVLDADVPARVLREAPAPLDEDLGRPALERIRARGFLRVGYLHGTLPFQFFNAAGDLVGFDAAMAYDLASQLGVEVEFVPIERLRFAEAVDAGLCDIIMSGIVITPARAARMALSEPYLDMTLALVVRDHRRTDFRSLEAIGELASPRIAVLDVPHYVALARRLFPGAELVTVGSPEEFFEDTEGRFDAFEYTAEMGSAYSLLHPDFAVAIPGPGIVRIPVVYAMAARDVELRDFVDAWVSLRRKEGRIDALYDYWILGKDAEERGPRWSLVRDVLGWVD